MLELSETVREGTDIGIKGKEDEGEGWAAEVSTMVVRSREYYLYF